MYYHWQVAFGKRERRQVGHARWRKDQLWLAKLHLIKLSLEGINQLLVFWAIGAT